MRIWELAQATGLNNDTIRYYEKRWLIKSNIWTESSNNYKDYDIKNIQNIEYIKVMKKLWLTLVECKNWLDEMENNTMTKSDKLAFISKKIIEIDKKISDLQKIRLTFIELSKSKDNDNVNTVKKMLFD